VYDIALTVAACLRSGTTVDVAWAVETLGFSSRNPGGALAITPGGGIVGDLLSHALDDQLADRARVGDTGRLVEVPVDDMTATASGLACGGLARCAIVPASELPAPLWERLLDRSAVCLVTERAGDRLTGTTAYDEGTISGAGEAAQELFRRGRSACVVGDDTVISVFWPVPRLVVVGGGAIAEAVVAAAGLLGWRCDVAGGAETATGLIAGLAAMDNLIVMSHDDEVAGPALRAALAGPVGYIGALGSRHTQESRARWLAARDVTDLSRVHGPAGLDVGANTPPEIAISILAEALAVRSGSTPTSLRDRGGPIHR